jgi:unsaturated rhamnogalacturonyl hydrolase
MVQHLAETLIQYRDTDTHLWYQVIDKGKTAGNYVESSASCMFVYCLAKGTRMGYLDKKYLALAKESFDEIVLRYCRIDSKGFIDLHGTCGATGLGSNPYRDGSFNYYTQVPQRTNDLRGIGAFLLAAIELERASLVTTKEEEQ